MPTFTFEKISSIARRPMSETTVAVMSPSGRSVRSRGVIVNLIDRLTEKRERRDANRRDTSFTEYGIKPRR